MPVCEVEIEFADGTYLCRLGLKQIAELQEKCGAGLGAIYKRVLNGDYRVEDCIETLRLGLVGGGMNPVDARRLVERYTDHKTFTVLSAWQHAFAIMGACVQGYDPPDEPKKKDAVKPRARKKAA